ncbi:hypothetical protein SFUMM280S_00727 [Streptomyces fumanus]
MDRRRWDPPAGVPLAGLLSGLRTAGPVLMVLSAPYFEAGGRTRDEWERALRDIAAADPSGFAAVSVTSVPVPAATAAVRPVDLTALGAEEAERRLLARLDLPADPLPERVDDVRYPASRPDVWGLVPRHNPRFTGREALLAAAHRLLRDAGRVTLHGMSGVGKTQMATEYVYRFGPEYDVVWWVHAESRATCRRRAGRTGAGTGSAAGRGVRHAGAGRARRPAPGRAVLPVAAGPGRRGRAGPDPRSAARRSPDAGCATPARRGHRATRWRARRPGRVLGPAHPFTGSALRGLAADLRALGRADEADRARERALDEAGHGGPARRYWDFEPHRT